MGTPDTKAFLKKERERVLSFSLSLGDRLSTTIVIKRNIRAPTRRIGMNPVMLANVSSAADHMENQAESDGVLQRDQRTQMTLKVARVETARDTVSPNVRECFPKVRFRPYFDS